MKPVLLFALLASASCVLIASQLHTVSTHSALAHNVTSTPSVTLNERVSVRVQSHGYRPINLQEGHDLPLLYADASPAALALRNGQVEPLTLTAEDFDEDGVPDLISAYQSQMGGILTLHRGNADSIFPNAPEAQRHRAEGAFTDSPFLAPANVFQTPQLPELVAAGDFDADGHLDVVIGARGDDRLTILRGDGKGQLDRPTAITLPGTLTALATGEIDRRDGLADLVVGVVNKGRAQALIFASSEGALRARVETIRLPVAATSFAFAQLTQQSENDLAIAAGIQLLVVSGRNRLPHREPVQAQLPERKVERRELNFRLRSIAAGDFTGDPATDLALLGEDGAVRIVGGSRGIAKRAKKNLSGFLRNRPVKQDAGIWPYATSLLCARVSSRGGDNLLIVDKGNRQLHILESDKPLAVTDRNQQATERAPIVELNFDREPVAVLPMRLNKDGLSDLVILRSGEAAAAIVPSAPAAIIMVLNNNDLGADSLRQAIMNANSSAGADEIQFDVGGGGLQTITLASALPMITETLVIDGTTQPGFAGQPLIELNGLNVLSGAGLIFNTADSIARGLVINRFGGEGINITGIGNRVEGCFIGTTAAGIMPLGNQQGVLITPNSQSNTIGGVTVASRNLISSNIGNGIQINGAGASNNLVQGNFIGTDVSGGSLLGNTNSAIFISGGATGNTIGGMTVTARNLLSGNANSGVFISGSGTDGNLIQGNFIGTDITGTLDLGNSLGGVINNLGGNNSIGGTPSAANRIAFNDGAGVLVLAGTGNRLESNSIFLNAQIGIDLHDDGGVTLNDSLDADMGGNDRQNFAVLTLVQSNGFTTNIQGTLNSTPNTTFTIQFFSNPDCDPSGFGEGQQLLGSTIVATDFSGNAAFTATVPVPVVSGQSITSLVTNPGGSTSEFSQCQPAIVIACSISCSLDIFALTSRSGIPIIAPASTMQKSDSPDMPTSAKLSAAIVRPQAEMCGAIVSYSQPMTSGSCGTVVCNPPSGSLFAVGTTQVICVTEAGPFCTFNVTVIDDTRPMITCPNIPPVKTTRGQETAVVTYPNPVTVDPCPGGTVTCTPPSGSVFPLGISNVDCRARDDAGNESVCQFAVTVTDGDNPTIQCPATVAAEIPVGQTSALVNYPAPTATDNLPGVKVLCEPPSGSRFALGITTVTCTATDVQGNQSQCQFTVSATGGTPTISVEIPNGDDRLEFGEDTPVDPVRKSPKRKSPCSFFTIRNRGFALAVLTLDSIRRLGRDVADGKISDANEGNLYELSILNADRSETVVSRGDTVRIGIGESREFCLRFTPFLPAVADRNDNLPATAVIPNVIASAVNFQLANGAPFTINVDARIDTDLKFVNRQNPRQKPILTFARSGNELIFEYSIFDSNLDVTHARYEFLDANGNVFGQPIEVGLSEPLSQRGLVKGQSFTVEQRFTGANTNPEIVGGRVTVFDRNTSISRKTVSPQSRATAALAFHRKLRTTLILRPISLR